MDELVVLGLPITLLACLPSGLLLCYGDWGIPFGRVKTVMDHMGFVTIPHNDKIAPDALGTMLCATTDFFIAGLTDHTIAISGEMKDDQRIYWLYCNDPLSLSMWQQYDQVAASWNSGTIEVSAWNPSADWRSYVSIDDVDSFSVSQSSNSVVRVTYSVLSSARPNQLAAVYVADNRFGPARLIQSSVGYANLEPLGNVCYDTLLQYRDDYLYYLDLGGPCSAVRPITELRKASYPMGESVLHFAGSADRPTFAFPANFVAQDNPMDAGQGILLSWNLSQDDYRIDCYNIYRAENSVSQLKYLASVGRGISSYIDSSLTPGAKYWYLISAAHHGGIAGAPSGSFALWNDSNPALQGPVEAVDNLANSISFFSERYDSLFACPEGDADTLRIRISVVGTNGVPATGIPSGEIALKAYEIQGVHFCNNGPWNPVSNTDNNGSTEFDNAFLGGCGLAHFYADVGGRVSDNMLSGNFRSVDLNGDGAVNLLDLPIFARSYNKHPGDTAYCPCCDFNWDGRCSLHDFGVLGAHYQHRCPSSSQYLASESQYYSQVELILDDEIVNGIREVRLLLEEASDISDVGIMLDNGMNDMQYLGFIPNPNLNKTILATTATNNGRPVVWLAAFGGDNLNGSLIELGRLRYAVSTGYVSPSSTREGPCPLNVICGEALDANNRLWSVRANGENGGKAGLPTVDYLHSSYPNPFNPGTYVEYGIAEDARVELNIYNVSGQLIKVLKREEMKTGRYRVYWDGKNDSGRLVSSGLYFCRLRTNKHEITRKLVLMK